jgi:Tfp pilus assembly protein PilO
MKLIYSISSLIIAGVLFFVFVDPLYGEVKQLRTDVATYNTALNNSTELQKTRDSLLEIYKNVKAEDKDRLDHFLPSTIGNIELILEIEKIANLHGMPIGDIKFDTKNLESTNSTGTTGTVVVAESDPSAYLPYGIFPMEFIIEGRYDTFVSFIKDLEHNLRLVDVKGISFIVTPPAVNQADTTGPSIYKYTVKVETYWLK